MSTMVEVKAAVLEGRALDWAVAKATGAENLCVTESGRVSCVYEMAPMEGCWTNDYRPSVEWSEGGPLIDQNPMQIHPNEWKGGKKWLVWIEGGSGLRKVSGQGDTVLAAVCQAIVIARLGDTVSVPLDLI